MNEKRTFHSFMLTILFVMLIAAMVSKRPDGGEPVVPTEDNRVVTVQVHWYEDEAALSTAFDDDIEGLAEWWIEDDGTVRCELHVVEPETVEGDPRMDTIGHELLHCLKGEFHEP